MGAEHDGERVDIEEHERQAAAFWAICALLVAVFSITAPPDARIVQAGGVVFVVAFLAANLSYAARITLGPPRGTGERFAAAGLITVALAFQQFLAGDLPMLLVLLPLYVLGAVAVLERRQRLLFVPIVIATALSPLLYDPIDVRHLATQVMFTMVVVMQTAMLGDYGDRLRGQRHALLAAEARAAERALTDELTGLRNRRALSERVSPIADEDAAATTVVYCDLDGFKPFNDRFGHSAGDALLRRLAQRLATAAGDDGDAYRVGGDEFCVLLDEALTPNDARVRALVAALAEDGPGYHVECSFGVATTPDDSIDVAGALQVADQRMYMHKQARNTGRSAGIASS